MWWLSGIFRPVALVHRPENGVDDVFAHADYDHATGLGTLRVEAAAGARVTVPELGIDISAGETATDRGRALDRRDPAPLRRMSSPPAPSASASASASAP